MARPPRHRLADLASADLSPVARPFFFGLPEAVATFIHIADSERLRRAIMEHINFPTDDMLMFLAVNQLTLRGAMRATDLAAAVQTGRPNLSQVVRRLEELDLVARAPDPDDNRGVLVLLTERGRELGEAIVAYDMGTLEECLEGWTPQERQLFGELFARVAKVMERRYPLG